MTQEDKKLQLIDLCARLPHGVICHTPKGDGHLCSINQTIFYTEYGLNINPIKCDYFKDRETEEQVIKPYLRPMSSMTKEELTRYDETREWRYVDDDHYESFDTLGSFDWLNANKFDYRGLIPMGLALEAPEGLYKTQ